MIGFSLPRDNNSAPVQALSPDANVTQSISSGGAIRYTLPADTELVRIASAVNCYVKFGNSAVVATSSDLLFPTGAEVFSVKARGFTHVSLLGIDVSPGAASVTQMI